MASGQESQVNAWRRRAGDPFLILRCQVNRTFEGASPVWPGCVEVWVRNYHELDATKLVDLDIVKIDIARIGMQVPVTYLVYSILIQIRHQVPQNVAVRCLNQVSASTYGELIFSSPCLLSTVPITGVADLGFNSDDPNTLVYFVLELEMVASWIFSKFTQCSKGVTGRWNNVPRILVVGISIGVRYHSQ